MLEFVFEEEIAIRMLITQTIESITKKAEHKCSAFLFDLNKFGHFSYVSNTWIYFVKTSFSRSVVLDLGLFRISFSSLAI
tara:strand:- start:4 stop:243 length:240 start_codon:yes stop_codon:yes gene_type:complete